MNNLDYVYNAVFADLVGDKKTYDGISIKSQFDCIFEYALRKGLEPSEALRWILEEDIDDILEEISIFEG